MDAIYTPFEEDPAAYREYACKHANAATDELVKDPMGFIQNALKFKKVFELIKARACFDIGINIRTYDIVKPIKLTCSTAEIKHTDDTGDLDRLATAFAISDPITEADEYMSWLTLYTWTNVGPPELPGEYCLITVRYSDDGWYSFVLGGEDKPDRIIARCQLSDSVVTFVPIAETSKRKKAKRSMYEVN